MVAFNYRFVPAVRMIRDLIDQGAFGRIYHWRAVYLQEWIMPHYGTPIIWRLEKDVAGSGALGDLGAHIIDLAHYLVGGIKSVSGLTKTFIQERDKDDGGTGIVDVDDAFAAAVEFENGAIGTLESTRFAAGRKNYNCFELNAEKGSVRFNLERMNEAEVFWIDDQPKATQGFHNVLVSEGHHPVVGQLVAARAHHRLGAHLRPRDQPPAGRHRQRQAGRPARRHLRGRLPLRRGLRRHRRVRPERTASRYQRIRQRLPEVQRLRTVTIRCSSDMSLF